jgi:hypothetical protein
VEFHAGRAKTDPVSGATVSESDVYLDVRDAPDAVMPELRRRLAAFKASSALSDCTGGFAAHGEARFTVRLDGDGLAVVPAGSLAGTPAGRCLEDRLRAALASMAIPPDGEPYQVGLALVSPPR